MTFLERLHVVHVARCIVVILRGFTSVKINRLEYEHILILRPSVNLWLHFIQPLHLGFRLTMVVHVPGNIFGADWHYSTWSRFPWSDIGYYHMVWMAVPLKIILSSSCFIFRFSDFSDSFIFRRRGSLRRFSKIFNQLIFSLNSGLFFHQSNISYVVLLCCRDWNSVIQIPKLKYFTHLSMYVLRFMCNCIVLTNNTFILLWVYNFMNLDFISYIFMLIWWRITNIVHFKVGLLFFQCHLFRLFI